MDDAAGGSLAGVLPWAVAVAAVATLLLFGTAVQRERQQLLGELVRRHVEERVLEVATAMDLKALETAAFHNRVQRTLIGAHRAALPARLTGSNISSILLRHGFHAEW